MKIKAVSEILSNVSDDKTVAIAIEDQSLFISYRQHRTEIYQCLRISTRTEEPWKMVVDRLKLEDLLIHHPGDSISPKQLLGLCKECQGVILRTPLNTTPNVDIDESGIIHPDGFQKIYAAAQVAKTAESAKYKYAFLYFSGCYVTVVGVGRSVLYEASFTVPYPLFGWFALPISVVDLMQDHVLNLPSTVWFGHSEDKICLQYSGHESELAVVLNRLTESIALPSGSQSFDTHLNVDWRSLYSALEEITGEDSFGSAFGNLIHLQGEGCNLIVTGRLERQAIVIGSGESNGAITISGRLLIDILENIPTNNLLMFLPTKEHDPLLIDTGDGAQYYILGAIKEQSDRDLSFALRKEERQIIPISRRALDGGEGWIDVVAVEKSPLEFTTSQAALDLKLLEFAEQLDLNDPSEIECYRLEEALKELYDCIDITTNLIQDTLSGTQFPLTLLMEISSMEPHNLIKASDRLNELQWLINLAKFEQWLTLEEIEALKEKIEIEAGRLLIAVTDIPAVRQLEYRLNP